MDMRCTEEFIARTAFETSTAKCPNGSSKPGSMLNSLFRSQTLFSSFSQTTVGPSLRVLVSCSHLSEPATMFHVFLRACRSSSQECLVAVIVSAPPPYHFPKCEPFSPALTCH